MDLKVGAIAIILKDNKILSLDCAKGRGIILPGGKFELSKDKTYRNAASRELFEETGVKVIPNSNSYLIYDGLGSSLKYYVYAFYFPMYDASNIKRTTREGKPLWLTIKDFKKKCSKLYLPFYDIMFEKLKEKELVYDD